jgi:hypothetical protein
MKRWDIVNKYINKYNYKSYIEIGTQKNATFDRITIEKTSVDPDPNAKADFVMSSDKFFEQVSEGVKWDIAFVDGLHHHEQAYKDILNCLKHLEENGTIVVHDCNPMDEDSQRVPRMQKHWNGDVWKAIVQLRSERDDLEIFTVDTDEGCTIIRKGYNKKLKDVKYRYSYLERNRKEWLNIVSVEKWLSSMGEDMSYKIWNFIPYSINRDYGSEVNKYCELVPNDNDIIIINDVDCLALTPANIHVFKNAIDNAPDDWGMLIPYTNRVKQYRQVFDRSQFDNPNIKDHREIALKLAKQPLQFIHLNIPISGLVMCFRKSTWKELGGFKSGIIGVDTAWSNKVRRSGKKIYLVNQLYYFHYYRFNTHINDKSHIT